MAIMKQHLSAGTAFPNSTFLEGLGSSGALPLGVVDMSTNDYPNAKIVMTIALSSASLDMGGNVEVYFAGSITNTTWTDGIVASSSGDLSTSLNAAQLIKTLPASVAQTSGTINWVCNDLTHEVGDLPPYWTLVIKNNSGQDFKSTGNAAKYYTVTYKGTT